MRRLRLGLPNRKAACTPYEGRCRLLLMLSDVPIKKNKYARNHLYAAGSGRSPAAPLYILHRSRPSRPMGTVAGHCHARFDRHLVYLFRQPQRTEKAGHPTAAGCRHYCLHFSFAIFRRFKASIAREHSAAHGYSEYLYLVY